MRHAFPIAAAAALALAACSGGPADAQTGAGGKQGERRFALEGFEAVSLAGPDDVEVRIGPSFSVVARGDTAALERLDIRRDGATLRVGRKRGGGGFNWGGPRDASVAVVVTLPRIRALSLAGSGDLSLDRAEGQALDISLAGSGDVTVARAAIGRGRISLAGSGDVRMAGTARSVGVSIVGSGDVDAQGLTAGSADVSIAGSGNVRFDVDGPARVSLTGAGDVDLGARARCESSRIGSGEVRCGG